MRHVGSLPIRLILRFERRFGEDAAAIARLSGQLGYPATSELKF